MQQTSLATLGPTAPQRRKRAKGIYPKGARRPKPLPEYLVVAEVEGILRTAPHAQARLLIVLGWRAGLRISEILNLQVSDLSLGEATPTLRVRMGKGKKDRVVPIHPELRVALENFLNYSNIRHGYLFGITRFTALRWVRQAVNKAIELNQLPSGRKIGTHTLRHSAARHWLASGVPINVVSRWLGHASIQTTLIYLAILPDPAGYMERVP